MDIDTEISRVVSKIEKLSIKLKKHATRNLIDELTQTIETLEYLITSKDLIKYKEGAPIPHNKVVSEEDYPTLDPEYEGRILRESAEILLPESSPRLIGIASSSGSDALHS